MLIIPKSRFFKRLEEGFFRKDFAFQQGEKHPRKSGMAGIKTGRVPMRGIRALPANFQITLFLM